MTLKEGERTSFIVEISVSDNGHAYVFEGMNNMNGRVLATVRFPKEAGWMNGLVDFGNYIGQAIARDIKEEFFK